ncbi:hypothetical protein [Prosthecobacter sp.]|uniref:hypothetical protein n=1 Tax=Prosthecobacter sp. TaxID=1965333 RepID=UPI003784B1D9
MIAKFNRGQVFGAARGLAGSAFCYALTWVFLHRVASALLGAFNISATHATWLSWLMVIVMTFSGWRTWKGGQGFENYAESVFSPDLTGSDERMWSRKMDNPGQELRGTAYVLSQLFLSGPLLLLKNLHRIRTRVPEEAGLEQKLADLLAVLHAANKWQGLADYPGQEREVLLLNLMKKIDFSQHKGNVRFKARNSDGI